MTPAPKLGTFRTEPLRKEGRIIDTWKFIGAQSGDDPVEVKVSMVPEGSGFAFVAKSSMFDQPLKATDLNELLSQSEAAAQLFYTAKHNIVWEDWLEVTVAGAARGKAPSASFQLSVEYRSIKRATLESGAVVTVSGNGRLMKFPEAKQATAQGIAADEMILDDRHNGCEVSYIRATDANVQALQSIQARMDSLRFALSTVLRQDVIVKSLANLNSLTLLPSPTVSE